MSKPTQVASQSCEVWRDGRTTDSHSVLYNVRYDEVLSISYSHGRDPLWNAPAGPRRVARAGGGFLGIFVEHDWISLHTTNARAEFVVLRLEDDRQTRRATAALAERTGRRAEPVKPRD